MNQPTLVRSVHMFPMPAISSKLLATSSMTDPRLMLSSSHPAATFPPTSH
jgi:hypothetical protein